MKKIILLFLATAISLFAHSQIKVIALSTTSAVITDANGTMIGSNTPRVCPSESITLEAYTKTVSKLFGTTMTDVANISGYQIQWYYKRHFSAPLSYTVKSISSSLNYLFVKNAATIIIKEPTIDTTTWFPISGATSPTFNFASNSFFTSYYDKTYLKFTVTYSTTTRTSDSITILRTTKPTINSFSVLPYYCPGKLIDVLPDVSVYNKYADTVMFGWQRASYANGATTGSYNPYIDSLHLAISPTDFGAYDYQLTASNMCGTSYSASLHSKIVAPTQAVNELISLSTLPPTVILNTCIGSQLNLGTNISPINSGLNHTYLYTWEYNDGSSWKTIDSTQQSIYSNFNSGTLSITPPNTATSNYSYRCKLTGLCANPTTNTIKVVVATPITITQVSATVPTICRDSIANLTVTATGSSPFYYRWITGNYVSDWSATANTFSYPVGEVNQQFRVEMKNFYCPDVPFKTTTVNVYDLPSVKLAATFSSCSGTNGDVSSTITGGKSSFNYVWNNASTSSNLKNVVPSTYSVTVTDACKEKGTESIIVSQLPALAVSVSTTNVSCYGLQNGKIAISVSGGKKNYQYKWADASAKGGNGIVDSVTNTVTIDQLKPGIYNVTITDDCSASIVKAITINQPEVLSSKIGSSKDVTCFGGADAWASVDVKGGNAPYVYNWNNLQNSQTAVGLFAGDYTVNVIDSKGCLSQAGITINQPKKLVATIIANDNSCYGESKGNAVVKVVGGTKPYSYSWNTGSNSDSIFNLPAKPYTCIVNDACNTSITKTANINQPSQLLLQYSIANPTCAGMTNGMAEVSVGGGVEPYSYAWSDTAHTTNNAIKNIAAGTYSVKVTDQCGLKDSISMTVYEPDTLTVDLTKLNATCNGVGNGQVTAFVKGGTSPYYFNWSSGQHSSVANSLFAGYYSVNIVDAQNCMASNAVTITEPAKLSINQTITNNTCNGDSNGQISVKASGSMGTYLFAWNNGSTNDTISTLKAGSYSVTVTDSTCNETISKAFTITEPTALSVITKINDVKCNGENNGNAIIVANGGTSPYKYLLNEKVSTDTLKKLSAGTYYAKTIDACNDTILSTITILQPQVLQVTTQVENVKCNGTGNGQITAIVNGGTSPYSFNWSTGQHGSVANGLYAGYYSVNIADAQNCMASNAVTITEPAKLSLEQSIINNTCNGDSKGQISTKANGSMSAYKYVWNNGSTNDTISKLQAGNYSVTVNDSICNEKITKAFIVTEPSVLTVTTKTTDVKCYGESNGNAFVIATGGTLPYKYLLNEKTTSDTLENVKAGIFIFKTVDACNDTIKSQIVISQPQSLQVATKIENVKCYGQGNGTISALATGGIAPYIYNWSNGFSGSKIIGLFPGTYTLNAFDSKGCLASRIVTITQPEPINIKLQNTDASCNVNDGKIVTVITGGTKPFSYSWSNEIKTSDNDKLTNGKYSLTVVDSLQCTETASTEIKTFVAPTQICLVTVDSITGKNKVVWEKIIDNTIEGYNIYKWGAFGYQKIGNVPHSAYSVFNDALSNPLIVASKYAISVIDKCKNESALSPSHQTIFLGASQGMEQGTAVLDWTEYIDESGGFVPTEYLIYRGQTKAKMEFLASVSVGTEYIDTNPQGAQHYRVIVNKKELCNVQGIQKSDSGPFSQSLSNMAESELTGSNIIETINAEIKAFPNPTDGDFTVSIKSEKTKVYTLVLSNVMGEILFETKTDLASQITIPISVPNLASGIYQLKVMTDEGISTQNIAISK